MKVLLFPIITSKQGSHIHKLLIITWFLCFPLTTHALLPVHTGCVNHSSQDCTTWEGYQKYKAAGCLYAGNKNSKCKKIFCESNCLPKAGTEKNPVCPPKKILDLCRKIRPGIPFNPVASYEFSLCQIFSDTKELKKSERHRLIHLRQKLLENNTKKIYRQGLVFHTKLVQHYKCTKPIFRDSKACYRLEQWLKRFQNIHAGKETLPRDPQPSEDPAALTASAI